MFQQCYLKLTVLSICEGTTILCQTHIRRLDVCLDSTSLFHDLLVQSAYRTIELASLRYIGLKTKLYVIIELDLTAKMRISELLCVCLCARDSRTKCEC
jgi:hypothetical protein